nr:CAZy families GH10 protein [uncultured Bacteroides sp.]
MYVGRNWSGIIILIILRLNGVKLLQAENGRQRQKEILTTALDTWINGLMESCNGYVTTWNAINEPMSDNDNYMLRSASNELNSSNFYWQDY